MRYQINRGSKSFGVQDIFKNITFEVKDFEKVAIVGRNGCGKTTLLKIIAKEESLDSGDIYADKNISIGYLSQTTFFNENHSVEKEFEQIFEELHQIEKKLEALTKEMKENVNEELLDQFGKLQHRHELLGGYTYKNEMYSIFTKFNFKMEDLEKNISEFSGGQKTRLAFVKLLLSKPDVLLLDEPTNHLDLDTIKWLEGYVKRYPKAVVVVSHDRTFLDEVVGSIFELENTRMTKYPGNYSQYVDAKKKELERNQSAYHRQQKEIEHLEDMIEKFRYKKNKAKMAQSKIKYLDRMEKVEKISEDTKTFQASFKSRIKGGRQVLSTKDLKIGYDNVLCNVNIDVLHGQRIAIIGANGQGKSTFLKTLMKKVPALSGSYLFGHQIEIGYFDQELTQFQDTRSVLETIWDNYPDLNRTQVRTALGSFLFQGDDVFKEVSVLSGGEKVRLSFVDLMLQKPNLLLLDEPTNHLDILGKEALETSLLNYDGTMLFVSHDRYFISKIANGILKLEDNQATYYPLTYQELNQKEEIVIEKKKELQEETKKGKPKHINYGKEISKLETKITTKEIELEELSALRYEPDYYHDPKKMKKLDEEIDEIHNQIAQFMKLWEEYNECLEEGL